MKNMYDIVYWNLIWWKDYDEPTLMITNQPEMFAPVKLEATEITAVKLCGVVLNTRWWWGGGGVKFETVSRAAKCREDTRAKTETNEELLLDEIEMIAWI